MTSDDVFAVQHLLTEMEGFKVQVQAVQKCMSSLQLPEDAVVTLPLCVTAQSLQQDSSHLQHTTIQQCNILQVHTHTLTCTSIHPQNGSPFSWR